MPSAPKGRDKSVVELVRLCGVSGAARLLDLQVDEVIAGYEIETGDVLPRAASFDEEVIAGCSALTDWAEAAGASPTEIAVELGRALRLPPSEVERLWRAMMRRVQDEQ